MKGMQRPQTILVAGLALVVVGCAPLQSVRDYASESATLSSYKTLTIRFRDTYERELPFVGAGTDCNAQRAKSQDIWRKSAYPDLVKIHDRVAEYMATLAVLAGDDTFDLSKPIAGLGDSIKKHPNLGIEAAQVDAYTQLGTIVSDLVTRGIQQKAIRDTVTRADPHVQNLLEGMTVMLDVYDINNSKERGCVVDFLKQESTIAMRSRRTALVGVLGRELAKEKAAEYTVNAAALVKASEGIDAMMKGHTELRENVNTLSSKELADTLKELIQKIRDARKAIDALS